MFWRLINVVSLKQVSPQANVLRVLGVANVTGVNPLWNDTVHFDLQDFLRLMNSKAVFQQLLGIAGGGSLPLVRATCKNLVVWPSVGS